MYCVYQYFLSSPRRSFSLQYGIINYLSFQLLLTLFMRTLSFFEMSQHKFKFNLQASDSIIPSAQILKIISIVIIKSTLFFPRTPTQNLMYLEPEDSHLPIFGNRMLNIFKLLENCYFVFTNFFFKKSK